MPDAQDCSRRPSEPSNRSNPSRFTDNPFRDPNISPEKAALLDRRNGALWHYSETGCSRPAIDLGLFNEDDSPGCPVHQRDGLAS